LEHDTSFQFFIHIIQNEASCEGHKSTGFILPEQHKLTPFVVVPFDENFEDENGKFDKELFSQFLCTCGEVDAALSRYITRSALPQC
jgi:hypothetical protein